jgi:hypothetical protein
VHIGIAIRFCPVAVVRHTGGTRYGIRAVFDLAVAYGMGQGAAAAKLAMEGRDAAAWRARMRAYCISEPLRSLRWHQLPARLPRYVAFLRGYRRTMRDLELGDDRRLRRRAPGERSAFLADDPLRTP